MTEARREYVIRFDTRAHPGRYVVIGRRLSRQGPKPDREPTAVTMDLGQARTHIPLGLSRDDYHGEEDDPCLVEVWR